MYNSNNVEDIIPFYNSTGILIFDGDSVQSIRLIMINDTLEVQLFVVHGTYIDIGAIHICSNVFIWIYISKTVFTHRTT